GAGIGNGEAARGLRVAGGQAPGGSRGAGAGARARGRGARDRRRAVPGARRRRARRGHPGGRRGGAVPSAWRRDAPANGREVGSGPMNARLLPMRSVPELARRRRDPVSKQALAEAAPIVDAVRTGGEAALREYAERFGDVRPEGGAGAGAGAGAPLLYERAALREALARLAAAAIAGADGVLAAGGAHAIAALAYGAGPIAPRDIIVGPGNRYVTAAKQLVAGAVAIDMLAGPSELTVFADDGADPGTVAAD